MEALSDERHSPILTFPGGLEWTSSGAALRRPILSVMIATARMAWFLFPLYLLNFGGIWLGLRRMRLDRWGETTLIHEDLDEPVTDLGIREMRRSPSVALTRG